MIKTGDHVKMSLEFKLALCKGCGLTGKHKGPFNDGDCDGCSRAHVEEFGDCVGIVENLTDFNNCSPKSALHDPNKVGPEFEVRWQPSKLRYAYHPNNLVKVK